MSVATPDYDQPIDLRLKLAQIDQVLADHQRIYADTDRIRADHDRKRQEIKYQPIVAMISGMTAGAALLAAGAAFTKIFGG